MGCLLAARVGRDACSRWGACTQLVPHRTRARLQVCRLRRWLHQVCRCAATAAVGCLGRGAQLLQDCSCRTCCVPSQCAPAPAAAAGPALFRVKVLAHLLPPCRCALSRCDRCAAEAWLHRPCPAPPCTPQGGTKSGGTPPLRLRTLTASPPLELTASHFALNRSGTYAAVAGSALEDPEISRVVVVDLTNCRPAPAAPTSPVHGSAAGGASRGGGAAPASAHAVHDVCEAVVLDAELFASRPGLRVLQIGWHPDSDSHLAVLTSGALHVGDVGVQVLRLDTSSRRRMHSASSTCGWAARKLCPCPPGLLVQAVPAAHQLHVG